MKLRLQGDSVRLRLSRGEVESLGQGLPLESRTRMLSGGELLVTLQAGPAWNAVLDGSHLAIAAPGLAQWAGTDAEGLYHSSGASSLAIEKDFACLHRDAEANEGTFPNPALAVKE